MSKNILVAYFSASGITAKAAWKDVYKRQVESSVVDETSASESSAAESEPGTEASQPDETETEAEGTKVLVAYFSATGTTEGVAEHIANGLNADIYEIVPEEPYTDADLNYNDNNSRTTIEMNDPSARPAI